MKMESWHWSTLDFVKSSFGLTDRLDGSVDNNIPHLVKAGYVSGEWFGSVNYSPQRAWKITGEGRKALEDYKLQKLISSTSQCPSGQCKGEYGTEGYVKTNCVKCGREIDQSKR